MHTWFPMSKTEKIIFSKRLFPVVRKIRESKENKMSEIQKYYQLDSEETEILDAYYQGRLDGPPVPESMVALAKQTLKKNKNILSEKVSL